MNHAALTHAATSAIASIVGQNPTSFLFIGKLMNDALDEAKVPFEERRYVTMAMADLALGRSNAIDGDSAKLLRRLAEAFLDQHAKWCGVGFFARRAPYEADTRRELALRRREQRELDGLVSVIDRVIDGVDRTVAQSIRALDACGAFKPAVTSTTVNIPDIEKKLSGDLAVATAEIRCAADVVRDAVAEVHGAIETHRQTEAEAEAAPKKGRAKKVQPDVDPAA